MGRYDVKYKGKWAAFSTITDSFITMFTDKEQYEKWRKEEYGRMYYSPVKEANAKTIEDMTFSIRLNRNHEEALKCLRDAGLSSEESEQILRNVEMKHWCPIPTADGKYKCPNCNEIVEKGQEQCKEKTCELKFVWMNPSEGTDHA